MVVPVVVVMVVVLAVVTEPGEKCRNTDSVRCHASHYLTWLANNRTWLQLVALGAGVPSGQFTRLCYVRIVSQMLGSNTALMVLLRR